MLTHPHDAIRDHLLDALGYPHGHPRLPDLDALRESEWCHEFEELRRNRLILGAMRYGLLSASDKWQYDLWAGLQAKLTTYADTGNLEAVVDAANYLMLIYMHPQHPNAHWRAEDDQGHCPTEAKP